MNALQVLSILLAVALGASIQGSLGFGLNLFAAPILAIIQTRLVPGPMLLGAMFLTILIVLRDRSGIDLHGIGWMAAGMLPGTILAGLLLPVLPVRTFSLVIGFLVLVGVAISLTKWQFPFCWWSLFLAGFASGMGSTLSSIGAPPVALVTQHLEPKRLRATLSGYFILSGIASLTALFLDGKMGSTELYLSLFILPGVLIGFLLSRLLIGRLQHRTVRYALLALSALSALVLIGQQIL